MKQPALEVSVRRWSARSARGAARALILVAGLLGAAGCRKQPASPDATPEPAQRLVVVGSSVTEIVFALGAGDKVVGVDSSSSFPPAAAALPKVGYHRSLSAEGTLSLQPTLVLLGPGAGPPAAIDQLQGAGIPVLEVAEGHTLEVARGRIADLAKRLGRVEQGQALVARLDADVAKARALAAGRPADPKQRPPVLFVFSHGTGTVSAGGKGNTAHEIIELAGGRNCVEQFEGFKPVTAEAALAAAPEIIAISKRGLQSVGGRTALLAVPGLAETPAAKAGRLVVLDDIPLSDVSPRMGEAGVALATALAALPAGPGLAREREAR